jgi:SAM-dependent methyltransferase
MVNLEDKIRSLETFEAIRDYLPDDYSSRQSVNNYVRRLCRQLTAPATVLDLGCGEGNSIGLFRSIADSVDWHGVDIADSPEVRKRTGEHESIQTFDGINLPYPDHYFDIVFCNQVLEHVRFPDALISDAFRVMKPNGLFIGAVSYLEPYHSYSIFNFTPYGIVRVFTDSGFTLEEIRPGPDASLFLNRQLLNRSRKLRLLWNRNYLHGILDLVGGLARLGHRERNFLKVQFAGHLLFLARRPAHAPHQS